MWATSGFRLRSSHERYFLIGVFFSQFQLSVCGMIGVGSLVVANCHYALHLQITRHASRALHGAHSDID